MLGSSHDDVLTIGESVQRWKLTGVRSGPSYAGGLSSSVVDGMTGAGTDVA